jgi:hypothetical protein
VLPLVSLLILIVAPPVMSEHREKAASFKYAHFEVTLGSESDPDRSRVGAGFHRTPGCTAGSQSRCAASLPRFAFLAYLLRPPQMIASFFVR